MESLTAADALAGLFGTSANQSSSQPTAAAGAAAAEVGCDVDSLEDVPKRPARASAAVNDSITMLGKRMHLKIDNQNLFQNSNITHISFSNDISICKDSLRCPELNVFDRHANK